MMRDVTTTANDPRDWLNVLAEVPLFSGLSSRHLKKVASLGRIRRIHEGARVIRNGEPGDSLYIVLDGEVSVGRRGLSGLTLGIGSFFGELALIDGGPRTATVVAKTPLVCLTIGRAPFLKLLRAEPAIAITVLEELSARLRAMQASAV
jgi:CRP/FNR family transcriptional regulator, cyclic AMP receptor protein